MFSNLFLATIRLFGKNSFFSTLYYYPPEIEIVRQSNSYYYYKHLENTGWCSIYLGTIKHTAIGKILEHIPNAGETRAEVDEAQLIAGLIELYGGDLEELFKRICVNYSYHAHTRQWSFDPMLKQDTEFTQAIASAGYYANILYEKCLAYQNDVDLPAIKKEYVKKIKELFKNREGFVLSKNKSSSNAEYNFIDTFNILHGKVDYILIPSTRVENKLKVIGYNNHAKLFLQDEPATQAVHQILTDAGFLVE